MASATSKTTACVCAFCAAEMAGELIRNQSEKLPVEGLAPVFGVDPEKALTVISCKGLISLAPRDGLEPPT